MKFKKKIKIFSSFLISLFLTSPFYTAMANNNPKQNNLKSFVKKANEKYLPSISDGKILKFISSLAGVGLLAIGGKKLMDRNSKKVINQSGNESIQNQDIQNQFYDVKKQNLEKYLPINIPMPKWTATKWDGGVGSCAIDSVLTIAADLIKVVLNKQAEYDKLNKMDKKIHFRTSEELLPCLMLIDELFENSKITGKQADIHKIEYDQLKSKYDQSKKHLDENGKNKTIGQVLTDILKKNTDIKISDTHIFSGLIFSLSHEVPNIFEVKWEQCEKSKMLVYYLNMQNVNSDFSDEFAFKVLSDISEKESIFLNGKEFMANGIAVHEPGHHFAFVKAPLESLTKELIEKKKWFIRRDGFKNKDCRCLIKDLVSFEDITSNYKVRVMSYRRVI
ncbi:MAG: hypothetical protein FWC41_08470 [Firmicutes bacterium]|nr:hypothetical protein [Bacillota bacterium]